MKSDRSIATKINCLDCGTLSTQPKHAPHKKKDSAKKLVRTQCPLFCRKVRNDSNCNLAQKHYASKFDDNFICSRSQAFTLSENAITLNLAHQIELTEMIFTTSLMKLLITALRSIFAEASNSSLIR